MFVNDLSPPFGAEWTYLLGFLAKVNCSWLECEVKVDSIYKA